MQGTRLPDAHISERGPGWDAWKNGECAPGSYMKVTMPNGVWWYVRDPHGYIGSIKPELHTVEEHADGTITVSPSLVMPHGGYHGWLRAGVWSVA